MYNNNIIIIGFANLYGDVFVEYILPLLDTTSLSELRRTNKIMHSFIRPFDPDDETSWTFWKFPDSQNLKIYWKRCKRGGIPKSRFVKTAFEHVRHIIGCQRCGARRIRKYYWEFAIRVCVNCLDDLTER